MGPISVPGSEAESGYWRRHMNMRWNLEEEKRVNRKEKRSTEQRRRENEDKWTEKGAGKRIKTRVREAVRNESGRKERNKIQIKAKRKEMKVEGNWRRQTMKRRKKEFLLISTSRYRKMAWYWNGQWFQQSSSIFLPDDGSRNTIRNINCLLNTTLLYL